MSPWRGGCSGSLPIMPPAWHPLPGSPDSMMETIRLSRTLTGDRARALGLPAAKRAAGVGHPLLPIPQRPPAVGPGFQRRLGQAVAASATPRAGRHRRVISRLGLPSRCQRWRPRTASTGVRRGYARRADPVIEKGIEAFSRRTATRSSPSRRLVIGRRQGDRLAAAMAPPALAGRLLPRPARPGPIYAVPPPAHRLRVTVAAGDLDEQRRSWSCRHADRAEDAGSTELMTGLPKP